MKRDRHPHADFTTYPKDAGTEGLSLFTQQPIEPPSPPDPERTIDEVFAAFHQANPHVYTEIERRALALQRVGAVRVGIGAIVEAMRYDYALRTEGDDYKLNNNFRSRYARLLVADHPELRDVVELRELRSA